MIVIDIAVKWIRAEYVRWLRRIGGLFERWRPLYRLQVVDGDSLPPVVPVGALVLARDEDENWCVGMKCPCGCGRTIELLLIPEAVPRWSLSLDPTGLPSLSPSVFLRDGCKSHFWLKHGRIIWA